MIKNDVIWVKQMTSEAQKPEYMLPHCLIGEIDLADLNKLYMCNGMCINHHVLRLIIGHNVVSKLRWFTVVSE